VPDLSGIFAALANDHRRTIVRELAVQPRSISSLADELDLSLPAIHKHIRVLEEAGLLRRRKVGRTNYLALERTPLQELQTWINEFQPWWGTGEESLTNYLDREAFQPKE
jgi:DNA-binding transcriptional ArsR family regulator